MSPQEEYLAALARVARDGRPDPLGRLLDARLGGSSEPVEGIVSPPLGRDEHDAAQLLVHLYRRLEGEEAARAYLRDAVAGLLSAALFASPPDLERIDALGRLTGYFQVAASPLLATRLHWELWGLLESGLERPLEQLMRLDGGALQKASRVLDLWLAVTPPLAPTLTERQRDEVTRLFHAGLEQIREGTLGEPRFRLLLLMFRALLKAVPREAGREGVELLSLPPELCSRFKDRPKPAAWYDRYRPFAAGESDGAGDPRDRHLFCADLEAPG